MLSCGVCVNCQRQLPNYCSELRAVGLTENGGICRTTAGCRGVLPQRRRHSRRRRRLRRTTVLLDVCDGQLSAGSRLGCPAFRRRPVGPTACSAAALRRGRATGGCAPTASKLALARSLGADDTVLVDRADTAASLEKLNHLAPDGFDVVIDASGATTGLQNAISLTRDSGTVLIYGMAAEDATITVKPYEIFRRQITIKGTFSQAYTFERAIRMIRSGRIRTDGLITHRFGLDDYAQALGPFKYRGRRRERNS